ncbi:MAG: metallophosphoesterase, partial [Clostridia bacterium]|nr:metallophosphoesterase [Clostridia bacterium]
MKKTLSLILCLCMLASIFAVAASASEEPLVINIASDIHFDQDSLSEKVPVRNSLSEEYSHVAGDGKLYSESKAVIWSFLEKAAVDSSQVILMPGDLADTGTEKEMNALAEKLTEFEKNTGKQIYVVPGNHDVSRNKVNVFASIFADFGYNEAIAKDENSGSYV